MCFYKTTTVLLFFCSYIAYSQCDFCGEYIGNNQDRYQKLIIKNDNTFEYEYRDSQAHLMGGFTEGKWKRIDDKLILNSEYDITDYQVYGSKVDMCDVAPKYLNAICDNIVKIKIADYNDNDIWFLKKVIVNNHDSLRGSIAFIEIENKASDEMAAFVKTDSINHLQVYNGFYQLLDVKISEPNINSVIVKGNFADVPWYTYFKNEQWEVKKNRLIKNNFFGNFKKQ